MFEDSSNRNGESDAELPLQPSVRQYIADLPQPGSFQMIDDPDDNWIQKQSLFCSFVPLHDVSLHNADQTLYTYMHEQYIPFFTDYF